MCVYQPTEIEQERRRRIKLTVAAYAYEFENDSIITDEEFDRLSEQIDMTIETGRLDAWWKDNFNPYTGMWIHRHPELDKARNLYKLWF